MKRPTRKLIAFSTAVLSMLSAAVPSAASAMYTADVLEECEYDELIEMRDKGILIKNGTDYNIKDDTQLVVIDENGEKKLISMDEGINGIYCYVSTTMGQYNFISPTSNNYSFDFFDQSYRISTESGPMIVGVGDKFAIMDTDGKLLSNKYNAIYRINDTHFIIDEATDHSYSYSTGFAENKCGLMDAEGNVVVAPADGVIGFYACGDYFIVKTEDGCYLIDSNGKKVPSSDFYSFENPYSYSAADNSTTGTAKYRINYLISDRCIVLNTSDGKKCVFDTQTCTFSEKYVSIDAYYSEKYDTIYIASRGTSDSFDLITADGTKLVENAKNITTSWDYTNHDRSFVVSKDGKTSVYSTNFDLIKSFPTHEQMFELTNGILTVDGTDVKVWDNDFKTSKDVTFPAEVEGAEVSRVTPNNYSYGVDFTIDVNYSYTTSCQYKFIVDSSLASHDVTQNTYAAKVGTDAAVISKDNTVLEYVDYVSGKSTKIDNDYDNITAINYEKEVKGFLLSSEDEFVIYDNKLENSTEPVKGTPEIKDDVVIFKNNDKYGIAAINNGIIVKSEYDSIDVHYNGFLAIKNNVTYILDLNGEELTSFDGAYKFVTGTGSAYDSNWNITKRVDGVTSSVVYNVNDKELRYEQEGTYDEVSYFIGDYAVVRNYADDSKDYDPYDTWYGNDEILTGLISIDGKELIAPTKNTYISIDLYHFYIDESLTQEETAVFVNFNVEGSGTHEVAAEDLDADFRAANNLPFAWLLYTDKYLTAVNGLWGMYDNDGTVILEPQFDSFDNFWDGLAVVTLPEEVEFKYYENGNDIDKYEGTTRSCIKTGIISDEGEIIVEPYTNVTEGMTVIGTVNGELTKTIERDYYGIHICKYVDGKMKYTTLKKDYVNNVMTRNFDYDLAVQQDENIYYVEKDGKAGLVTKYNNVIVPVEYDYILSFNPSDAAFFYVRKNIIETLEEEFSSKINYTTDGKIVAYVVKNGKIGAYIADPGTISLGDVDGDGAINSSDASQILVEYSNESTGKPTTLDREHKIAGDVDCDGAVNASDASHVLVFYSMNSTGRTITMDDYVSQYVLTK